MFSLSEILKVCNGKLMNGHSETIISGISTDSRAIEPGDLFVALKGENFDGHQFIKEAHEKGAVGVLVQEAVESLLPSIFVPDTLKAFQALAQAHRSRFSIPVVGVTGSVGKTTTKECIAVALSDVFKVRASYGNWNNHIGVPTNILRLTPGDQCLVLEMGANHPGEIKQLAQTAQPTVGVITAIHPVHLEGFGSLEGIYKAKLELADFLDLNYGTVIANGDDAKLVKKLKNRNFSLITFGTSRHCDYRMTDLSTNDGLICFRVNDEYDFRFKGYGSFNAANALAAIAVAGYFNLDLNSLSESWRILPTIQGRFAIEKLEAQDMLIVDDSYNANPFSFKQAIQSFIKLAPKKRKLVVVGDMLELGQHSGIYHEDLGRYIAEENIDLLIGVGPMSQLTLRSFAKINEHTRTFHFRTALEAGNFLVSIIEEGDSIFIKGSHGMKLEQIRPLLTQAIEIAAAF